MPLVRLKKSVGAPPWLRPLTSAATSEEISFANALQRATSRLAAGFNFREAIGGMTPGEIAAVISQMPWEDYSQQIASISISP